MLEFFKYLIFLLVLFLLYYLPFNMGGMQFFPKIVLEIVAFSIFSLTLVFWKFKIFKKFEGHLLFGFIIFSLISVLLSHCYYDSFIEWVVWISYIFVFIAIAQNIDTKKDYNFLEIAIILFGFVISLVGLYYYIICREYNPSTRFFSVFYQADLCSTFFLLIIPICLIKFLSVEKKDISLLYGAILLPMLLGFYFTHSRGGMLVFIIVLGFLIYMLSKYIKLKIVFSRLFLIFMMFLILKIALDLSFFKAGDKTFNVSDIKTIVTARKDSIDARFAFWEGAFHIANDYPLYGTGPKTFGKIFPRYEKNASFFSKYVHNNYLQIASECGWITLLFFLGLLGAVFLRGFNLLKKNISNEQKFQVIGIIGSVMCFCIHTAMDLAFSFPGITIYFAVICALLFSRYQNNEQVLFLSDRTMIYKVFYYFMAGVACLSLLFILKPYKSVNFQQVGRYYLSQKDYENAVKYFVAAKNTFPIDYSNFQGLSETYENIWKKTGNKDALKKAILFQEKVIFLDRARAINYYNLARLNKLSNDEKKYLENMDLAIYYDPINFPFFYNELAQYSTDKGDYDKALYYYLKVTSYYPENFFNEVYIWDFRVESLVPQLFDTYIGLANVYILKDNYEPAMNYIKNAEKIGGKNDATYFVNGLLLFKKKDIKGAVLEFAKISKKSAFYEHSKKVLDEIYGSPK